MDASEQVNYSLLSLNTSSVKGGNPTSCSSGSLSLTPHGSIILNNSGNYSLHMGIIQTTVTGPGARAKLSWISLVLFLWNQRAGLKCLQPSSTPGLRSKGVVLSRKEEWSEWVVGSRREQIKDVWGSVPSEFLKSISDIKFLKMPSVSWANTFSEFIWRRLLVTKSPNQYR